MPDTNNEKWVFIVNPIAGNGFAGTLVPAIKEMINKHMVRGEVVLTTHPGHATLLSKQFYEQGYSCIIGVGGDGTVNEVARPLAGKKDVTLGVVPAGTGNDFIQILGFPHRFEEREWDILFKKATIMMDGGYVNGKIFLNGMGLGFDAQVAAENYTEPGEVKKGGAHKYIWHIIKTLLFFREMRMKIRNGNSISESDCFINTISIGRRFAGSFYLTPGAFANDGLLDVCSIKRLNLFQRFRILLKVPKGEHINDKKVNYYKTTGLDIEFPREVPFHVDGELFFSQKFTVNIVPDAFNIIYNPDGNHFFKREQ
ncbi:MAG: diacylglycerol kinase family protein [Bacteroidales bacterium]